MTILRTAESHGSFRVTYDVTTEESAQHGDLAERGWLDWRGNPVDEYWLSDWDFRDLIDKLAGYYVEGSGGTLPSFLCIYPECQVWLSSFWRDLAGDDAISATAYVHRPGWISDGSWARVCRSLGWISR